jgi:cytochrome c-type biogenesis protein CcmH/NrfG
MTGQTDWVSAVAILASGLILGLMLMFYLKRRRDGSASSAPDRELQDLEARRDLLITQLREIDDVADATPEQLAERRRLEMAAADVLRAIDGREHSAIATAAATPAVAAQAAPVSASAAAMKGFVWGVLSVGVLVALGFFVYKSANDRGAGDGPTGSAMAPNEVQQPPAAQDPAVLALEAAVQKNPDDIEQRIELSRVYLEHDNLMGVFEQTGFVLKTNPNEPRAMTYQALVRLAMGQTDEATAMLKKANELAPDFIDSTVALAWIYTQQGNMALAETTMRDAMKRHPQDRVRLEQVLADMKAHKDEPQTARSAGPVDPNAPLPPGHPSLDGSPAPAMTTPPVAAATDGTAIRVTVNLDPSARNRSDLGQVLYVIARPAGMTAGPPVAVKRLAGGPWPMTFELSSADSMMGQKLPPQLRIDARLDADGDAKTHTAGDIAAGLDGVAAGASIQLNLK